MEGSKTLSLKKQVWSVKDLEKLFEFILLNPHLVGSSTCSTVTTTALHKFTSAHKTYKDCEIKMVNLAAMKSYDKMVDYLRKKTQLSEEWILEKKNESGYFHISHFHKELMELMESQTIENLALRMFLSSFYHKEAESRPAKSSFRKIVTNSSDHSKNHSINQPRFNESPQKVIKFKIIDPTEEKIDASDKLSRTLFSTEKIITDTIGEQQNCLITCEQKETETLDLKTYKWNSLQKLSYLVFILKYQMQFEHASQNNLTETIAVRLTNFMRTATYRDCNQYHVYLMGKHKTVEKIISQTLNEDLFIKENEVMREIKRIQAFYEQDLKRQLNAFTRKSKLTLESSDAEIFEISCALKQQMAQNKNFQSLVQQSINQVILHQSSSQIQQPKLQFENEMHPFQLPVELTIVFETEDDAKNPSQFVVKVQNEQEQIREEAKKTCNPRIRSRNNYQRQDFRIVPKKECLKQKKIEKTGKSQIQRLQNSKEDVFFEDGDFNQFNAVAWNHSESRSNQNSSENEQQINEEDYENQKQTKTIQKNLTKKRKFNEDETLNSIISNSKLYLEKAKLSIVKRETHDQKQHSNNFWTLSQRMKVIVFMTVNKQTFIQGNYFDKYGIRENLSKYVGTSRSNIQCKAHMNQLKEIHRYDMDDLLRKEGKKFGIDDQLLKKWKQINASYQSKNHVTIENYSLEVAVLPMKYVIGSPNKILPQLCYFLKQGPVFELIMREKETEGKKLNDDSGKIIQKSTISKKIRFQLKIQTKCIKITQIKIELIWNWIIKRLDEIIKH